MNHERAFQARTKAFESRLLLLVFLFLLVFVVGALARAEDQVRACVEDAAFVVEGGTPGQDVFLPEVPYLVFRSTARCDLTRLEGVLNEDILKRGAARVAAEVKEMRHHRLLQRGYRECGRLPADGGGLDLREACSRAIEDEVAFFAD